MESHTVGRRTKLFIVLHMKQSVSDLILGVFSACQELSRITGRPFSPDGHLVGSLGEVFAADQLGLILMSPSNHGYDAIDSDGLKVEIKATTRNTIALSASGTLAERLVVVQFDEAGSGVIAYDGPAGPVWAHAGPKQKNGQRRISIKSLSILSGS